MVFLAVKEKKASPHWKSSEIFKLLKNRLNKVNIIFRHYLKPDDVIRKNSLGGRILFKKKFHIAVGTSGFSSHMERAWKYCSYPYNRKTQRN